jgi:hypothetical protein
MEFAAILALIEKGLLIVDVLNKAGHNEGVQQAIKIVTDFIGLTKSGEVTGNDITNTETLLDGLLDEFNETLPPE